MRRARAQPLPNSTSFSRFRVSRKTHFCMCSPWHVEKVSASMSYGHSGMLLGGEGHGQ